MCCSFVIICQVDHIWHNVVSFPATAVVNWRNILKLLLGRIAAKISELCPLCRARYIVVPVTTRI